MEITEVKVFPVNEEKLKAFVSIVLDRCFMVNDIKIIQGRDGLFISMPSRKKKNGEFKDIAHPLNNDTRRRIELEVVGEYERVLAERGESLPAPARAHNLGDSTDSDGDGRPEAATAPPAAKPVSRPVPEPASGDGGRSNGADPEEGGAPKAPESLPPAAGPLAPTDGDARQRPAAAAAEATAEGDDAPKDDNSLEEVQEKHLRDSFWSVT